MFHAHNCEQGQTKSRLAVWLEIQRRSGKEIKWLKERPNCPDELQYVWDLYLYIRRGCPLVDYQVINNYVNVTGDKLTHREVDLLIEIEYLRQHPDD